MPYILFNLLARKQIVKNLPPDIFPKGFILTMLVNSPTFGKHKCDFLKVERWDRKRMKFFDGFHGKDSAIVKGINEEMRDDDNVKELIAVKDNEQLSALKELLTVEC